MTKESFENVLKVGEHIDNEMIGRQLFQDVRAIIEEARRTVRIGINTVMIDQNWRIGRRIVEEEQKGEMRAEYGKRIVANLSTQLTAEYGEGYSERSLWEFRRFYQIFGDLEILHTRVQNLNWSHFRQLMRVSDEKARLWYAYGRGTAARNRAGTQFA